ncbi:MAG TPA: PAS domain S-box protein [Balneolales bacterium]|nr:PAS domain S-box protein [Balneolales bacterium]
MALFKNNPVPSWIYDPVTKQILDVNQAAVKIYGYTRDEFLSISVDDLFTKDSVTGFNEKSKQNGGTGKDLGQWQHKTKDNKLILVEIFEQDWGSSDKRRLLTARRLDKNDKLEKDLQKAFQQLNFHVNNSPLGVIEWDHDFRVQKWSDKAEEIFGWKFSEVRGKKPEEFNFFDDDDYDIISSFMQKLRSGEVSSGGLKNKNRTKSGKVLTCEWYNSVLLDDKHELVSILSQVQDVTQQEKYERLILGQKSILQLIASGHSLENTLKQITYLIQQNTQNAICSIMIRDGENGLKLGAAPDLPEDFCELIEYVPISPENGGICGRSAYEKREVSMDEIDQDLLLENWSEALTVAKKHNLNTSRSIPVLTADEEVIGTFALYYQNVEDDKRESDDVIQIAKDLTRIAIERDRSQRELFESETKFKTLFDYANDGIFILDEYRFVDCNRRILELLGCSKSEVIGKTPLDFSPEKQKDGKNSDEKAREMIDLAMKGEPQFFSWTHLKKSGEPIEVEVSLNRMPLAGKYYSQAIVRDVTKQKAVERELRENRLRLGKLLKNLPGMVYRCHNDRDWTLEFVSEGCYDLTGYTVDELMDENWRRFASLILPEDREDVWQSVQKALKQNKPYELEYRIKTADGSIKWVWEKGSSLYYPDMKREYLEGFITDITEHKKAQEELRIKEKAIESSNNSIILIDMDGYITYANPSFLDMWGYDSLDEVLGILVTSFNISENQLSEIKKQLKEKRQWSGEIETHKKNGDLFVVQLSASMVTDNEGTPICMMASLIDVTDRNLAETKLRKSLKEKEVLLSEIHHRVKNNLAVISGLLELQAYNTEDEGVKAILQDSQTRIQSIAMIHEKLYRSDTFSKIELQNYISELVNNIKDTYNNNSIDIQIMSDEIYLNITQAIPCALILNELIVNAFKHAFKGLKKGQIVIEMAQESSGVKLCVRDNGVGLPENFNLLSQKSLGMTLVKTLVRQLNADFDINNNEGSEFIIGFELD